MRTNISLFAVLATTFCAVSKSLAKPDPNFHIYLGIGQSNMEGQGPISEQDLIPDDRFKMLCTCTGCRNRTLSEWYDATPPLSNRNGKLGPTDYFGRTLVQNLPEQIKVGVVVVAVAGSSIQLFEKENYQSYEPPSWMVNIINYYDGNPYGRLIDMAKKAQEVGVIKGILLHQGESNEGEEDWPIRVKGVYENILNDLGLKAEDVPLLAGEVAQTDMGGMCGKHNVLINKLPEIIPTAHVVSSKGLEIQNDNLHFTSESYRIFGVRYAEEMLKLL
ncbi:carbohydrate esterase family 6 protein, partial [Piromyces sp. E2]